MSVQAGAGESFKGGLVKGCFGTVHWTSTLSIIEPCFNDAPTYTSVYMCFVGVAMSLTYVNDFIVYILVMVTYMHIIVFV